VSKSRDHAEREGIHREAEALIAERTAPLCAFCGEPTKGGRGMLAGIIDNLCERCRHE
jgi:hypothetical protein